MIRPMTMVVVREEPAGGSGAGASAFAAGAAAMVVDGAAEADAGLAVVWATTGTARRIRAKAQGSAQRRFMVRKTIDRGHMRQATEPAA